MVCLDGRPADQAIVRRMAEVIRHRGPDDSGEYVSGPIGFGFRRLSILDLTPSGHQPMSTPDGRFTIVFNGEIYNYRELRRELEAAGHVFRSTGDTEVLLHAYLQWGPDCLSRLNGMWAFLIHDRVRRVVFGSRDRFGIKPLFMYRDPRCVLFASEIKAIRASGLWQGDVNWPVAADFLLRTRLDQTRETFWSRIERIPPASAFELAEDGSCKEWVYWQIDCAESEAIADPAGEFAELFEDAIRLHMRSDVPVGVHLSGGMDSTSIICAAARVRASEDSTSPLMAFSYMAEEYDETSYISDTLQQTGARLTKLRSDPVRFWSRLNELMWFQDEPFHSIYLLVAYELMRLTAASGIKVVLNGQGADETLAGYLGDYARDYWNSLLRAGRFGEAWAEMGRYAEVHGGSRGSLLARQSKQLLQGNLAQFGTYRRLSAWRRRRRVARDDWFTPTLQEAVPIAESEVVPIELNSSLVRSIVCDPLPLYLRLEDRNSMAHSIEARVPFLDHRLVEFEFALPLNWRVRGPWNKYVLREAMRGRIPESVRTRPEKFGFPVPVRDWMGTALYESARDIITSQASRDRGIYNIDSILRDLECHKRGEIDVGRKIFNVVQFETWAAIARQPAIPPSTSSTS
jgi:asparagine synthase (glutamine-hydrolysing)